MLGERRGGCSQHSGGRGSEHDPLLAEASMQDALQRKSEAHYPLAMKSFPLSRGHTGYLTYCDVP